MTPSWEPKHTGDWKCKGCHRYFYGRESNQHYNLDGTDGPYCNECEKLKPELQFYPEER